MKRLLLLLCLAAMSAVRAEMLVGVQLYDMFKTEAVSVMTAEEYRELKEQLAEEKAVFGAAVRKVQADWNERYKAAVKAGDKDFPKYPSKPFVWVRTCKVKNFTTQKAADEWLAKQSARVNAEMAARANAATQAAKAAKGSVTSGYSGRDDKKNRRRQDKAQMDSAVREKLAEEVELQMATLLKYNRPVPRHFIVDPVAGAEKTLSKQMAAQEAALKAYRERRAAAEAAEAEAKAAE